MKKIWIFWILAFIITPLFVLAQTQIPSPPALPLEGVATSVDSMTAMILKWLPYIGGGIVAEIVGRLVPTNKPLGVIAGIGRLLGAIGGLFMAIDKGISAIVPQRLKS